MGEGRAEEGRFHVRSSMDSETTTPFVMVMLKEMSHCSPCAG
jgi:hypothetical protein